MRKGQPMRRRHGILSGSARLLGYQSLENLAKVESHLDSLIRAKLIHATGY
ncbi:hypothetical protein [Sphingobium yanoikuyae]|uniref:hypothetical protein n=1 Tax=Sphingobium yanoikuyae TaxID=13690 RepID=UPI00293E7E05|nr:hypothetical protein [Sphingobium yanoikuyae]